MLDTAFKSSVGKNEVRENCELSHEALQMGSRKADHTVFGVFKDSPKSAVHDNLT